MTTVQFGNHYRLMLEPRVSIQEDAYGLLKEGCRSFAVESDDMLALSEPKETQVVAEIEEGEKIDVLDIYTNQTTDERPWDFKVIPQFLKKNLGMPEDLIAQVRAKFPLMSEHKTDVLVVGDNLLDLPPHLLENPNYTDPDTKLTALTQAVIDGDLDLLETLLSHELIDVNHSLSGTHPLIGLAFRANNESEQYKKCLERLIACPDINLDPAANVDGYKVIHAIAQNNNIVLFDLLLDKVNFDLNIGTHDKRHTPIYLANLMGNSDIEYRLKKLDANNY